MMDNKVISSSGGDIVVFHLIEFKKIVTKPSTVNLVLAEHAQIPHSGGGPVLTSPVPEL